MSEKMIHHLKTIPVAACLCVAPPSLVAAQNHDRYLCITDTFVGLDYNQTTKKWVPAIFTPGNKYILRYVEQTETGIQNAARNKWAVFNFGIALPLTWCGDDSWSNEFFYCAGFEIFSFQKESLRFQHIYRHGYVHGNRLNDDDGVNDTPAISIGTCSPF